jgi:hypothetical protein
MNTKLREKNKKKINNKKEEELVKFTKKTSPKRINLVELNF